MGAGKTSVGRALARSLGIGFVDSDCEIETAAGASVVDIFSMYGEQEFRRAEKSVIERLLVAKPRVKVISTGEGAFITPAVREMVLRDGFTVVCRKTWRRCHRQADFQRRYGRPENDYRGRL